ncbi:MAG TPA: hypothetical protein PLM69_09450 [Syntrophales bacterium]|nr:hypothetical protein [Syntrophales bacterium]HQJ30291.1 hypothetical protein [Syntrophales bacterium]
MMKVSPGKRRTAGRQYHLPGPLLSKPHTGRLSKRQNLESHDGCFSDCQRSYRRQPLSLTDCRTLINFETNTKMGSPDGYGLPSKRRMKARLHVHKVHPDAFIKNTHAPGGIMQHENDVRTASHHGNDEERRFRGKACKYLGMTISYECVAVPGEEARALYTNR